MRIFGNPSSKRGCFMLVNVDANASRGAVLRLPAGGDTPTSWQDPYLITSVSLQAAETVMHAAAFSDVVFTYALGNDPQSGKAAVTFMVLLGDAKASPLGTMLNLYRNNRVSVVRKKAQLYISGGQVIAGYVSSMESQTADLEIGTQSFVFNLDVPRL